MSVTFRLEPHDWHVFSVPHSLCLMGEYLHLIGSGTLSLASNLRLRIAVQEARGRFELRLGGGRRDETGRLPAAGPDAAALAARWEQALPSAAGLDADALEGLAIEADFGPLWRLCPPHALAASPALAVGLIVAVSAHRGAAGQMRAEDLARGACRLRAELVGGPGAEADASYSEALISLVGGVGCVAPDEERLNVQEMLPPESLLLVLTAGAAQEAAGLQGEAKARAALARARAAGFSTDLRGDEALAALFELGGGALSEDELTVLYGLLRMRDAVEGFVERMDDLLLDNDRLAEVCDDESAVMADYFGFPASHYDGIRRRAGEVGALGAKLTWAFGGYPAAVIIAPGDRQDVGAALKRAFPQAHCLLVDPDPNGVVQGEDEEFFEDEG